MTIDITYIHINRDMASQFADGAYCTSGYNGNVFLNFFQEIPSIPEQIAYHDSSDMPEQKRMANPMEKSNLPYYANEDGLKRVFVGKVQLTPQSARQLMENIQLALNDMEK